MTSNKVKDIEDLIPWERDIYVGLLINYLEEEKEAMERNKWLMD